MKLKETIYTNAGNMQLVEVWITTAAEKNPNIEPEPEGIL